MDVETKVALASKPPAEEVVTQDELRQLFETKEHPVHYVGLEISGLLHLGSLFFNGMKINDLSEAGVKCQVFLADWHSVLNNKLGGDWEKINTASKYYEEAFKFYCPKVSIVRGSELYHENDDYWKHVADFSRHVTLARATRCVGIMGRSESESLSVAQYLYPSMQAVDIPTIGADIAHAGMDQRKVHMLARETLPKIGLPVPIALHHHILPGLLEPEKPAGEAANAKEAQVAASKMSKSKPGSAIFIHDSKQEIADKLKKAYCPPKVVEANPVLEISKYLVLRDEKSVLHIERPEKFGGNLDYSAYAHVEKDFVEGKLHPTDLKNAVAIALDGMIAPVREHFEKRKDLLEVYKQAEITR
ncbi:MAG: tyrosine--tRNA ligase [Candidatus Micrarchaeia archaeon]|jgi:tyrosyl-tRNA synthetase